MARNIQALVLGNGSYAVRPLRCAVNDALEIAVSLENLGVSVEPGTNLTFDETNFRVERFLEKVNLPSTAVSLLYYSGHAIQVDNENYIIPIDFDSEVGAAKLVSMQRILDRMTSASAVRIVIMDACRSNPHAKQVVEDSRSIRGIGDMDKGFYVDNHRVSSGLGELNTTGDTFIAFSTAPNQVALDGSEDGIHSPFTKALLKSLEVVDLPLSNLTGRVRQEVWDSTGKMQRTWDQSSLTRPFYFNPGTIFFFTANILAVLGLIFSVLTFAFVFRTPDIEWPWIAAASALPVASLASLLYATQTVYSRLRGNLGWDDGTRSWSLRRHFVNCLQRGLIGGYLGALITALPLCLPYYAAWHNPDESLGQLLVEGTLGISFAACTLGFLCTFFARLNYEHGDLAIETKPSVFRTLRGSIIGGIITGIIVAPVVTLYFGLKPNRPEVTPTYLLPAAILGASFIIFSIINFDFERLSSRRIWTSACAAFIAILAGTLGAAVVFGPLTFIGLVELVTKWMEHNSQSAPILLAGGATYGIPVGIILGFVIGIAVSATEKWSKKPVLV